MSDVFACVGVARTFGVGQRAVVAVHDVNCFAWPGARIAIVGPSGSGKSTLIQLIAGIDEPTSGMVIWPAFEAAGDERIAGSWDPSRVGVIFQNESLIPALTAEENVALPLAFRGVASDEAQDRASDALARLRLDGVAQRYPGELSAGQAQRVAVARVMASAPVLILADEPTGRLDQAASQLVVEALIEVADEVGAALIVATHDPLIIRRLETCWRMTHGALELLAAPNATRASR